MPAHGTRRHRLPRHRPDYILVPASGDVSLSKMGEESPLPAIVVTPSSPSCSADFSIAFVAPPEKPSACKRVFTHSSLFNLKARTTFLLLLLLFVMACHLLTHRLATSHPHLQFGMIQGVTEDANLHIGWFNWQALWDVQTSDIDSKREFVVTGSLGI